MADEEKKADKAAKQPKGVMSDTRAREEKVGGEILCDVF